MASFVDRDTIANGGTYTMPQNGHIDIGAVSGTVTVEALVGDSVTYRTIGTVATGAVMRAYFVSGQILKFTGSNAEITAFA